MIGMCGMIGTSRSDGTEPELRISPARKGAGQSVSNEQRIQSLQGEFRPGSRVLFRERAANRSPLGPRPAPGAGRGLNKTQARNLQVPCIEQTIMSATCAESGDMMSHQSFIAAGVAKPADAPDLGSGPERGVGSSPSARIIHFKAEGTEGGSSEFRVPSFELKGKGEEGTEARRHGGGRMANGHCKLQIEERETCIPG